MKTQANKLNFKKNSVVELNTERLQQIKGGSFTTSTTSITSIIQPSLGPSGHVSSDAK